MSIFWGQCVGLGMTESEGISSMEGRLSQTFRLRVDGIEAFPGDTPGYYLGGN